MNEIEEYSEAYEALYGNPPVIERRGSWIAIGDCPPLKVRKFQLPAMTDQLRYRLKQKTHGA